MNPEKNPYPKKTLCRIARSIREGWSWESKELPKIPSYMQLSLGAYVKFGVPTGGFLRSILENNFVWAAQMADDANRHLLLAYAYICYSHIPSACWGSAKIVSAWIDAHWEIGSQTAKRVGTTADPANEGRQG